MKLILVEESGATMTIFDTARGDRFETLDLPATLLIQQERNRPQATTTSSKRIALNLYKRRQLLGLTLQKLSDHSKISVSTISGLETGKYRPSILLLDRLAACLQTSLKELVT